MTQNYRETTLGRLSFLPLHALIRKYPYGVISENERWTTGLVCPLHVRGICLAMFPILKKINTVKMKNPSWRLVEDRKMEIVKKKMNADS